MTPSWFNPRSRRPTVHPSASLLEYEARELREVAGGDPGEHALLDQRALVDGRRRPLEKLWIEAFDAQAARSRSYRRSS